MPDVPVSHPYDIPVGVNRGRVLGDPVLIICATILVLGVIGALVILSVTNHSSEGFRYVSLGANGFVGLVVLLGLGKRTGDVHAQSQATYQRLNGELDKRITDAVVAAMADRRAGDPPGVSFPDTGTANTAQTG